MKATHDRWAPTYRRRTIIENHDHYLDELGDYDNQIKDSWRAFIDDLAAYLGALNPITYEFVELSHPMNGRDQPLISFRVNRSRRLRATIPKDALALGYSPTDQPPLTESEWRYLPRKHEYVREFGRKHRDLVAAQTVTLLRRHWGVIHPSFLTLRDPSSTVHPLTISE